MSNGPIVISDKLDSWCVGLGPIIVICGPANQKTILRGTGGHCLLRSQTGGCALLGGLATVGDGRTRTQQGQWMEEK